MGGSPQVFVLSTKIKNDCPDCLVLADTVSLIHLHVGLIDRVPMGCFQVFKKTSPEKSIKRKHFRI